MRLIKRVRTNILSIFCTSISKIFAVQKAYKATPYRNIHYKAPFMKRNQQNAKVIEEQNITIIDYYVNQATPLSQATEAKSSRGWFNLYERLKYQIETERKRECLRCEARK